MAGTGGLLSKRAIRPSRLAATAASSYVVPDLDLVTVITSNPETSGVDPKILISRTIVPAVTG